VRPRGAQRRPQPRAPPPHRGPIKAAPPLRVFIGRQQRRLTQEERPCSNAPLLRVRSLRRIRQWTAAARAGRPDSPALGATLSRFCIDHVALLRAVRAGRRCARSRGCVLRLFARRPAVPAGGGSDAGGSDEPCVGRQSEGGAAEPGARDQTVNANEPSSAGALDRRRGPPHPGRALRTSREAGQASSAPLCVYTVHPLPATGRAAAARRRQARPLGRTALAGAAAANQGARCGGACAGGVPTLRLRGALSLSAAARSTRRGGHGNCAPMRRRAAAAPPQQPPPPHRASPAPGGR